MNLFFAALLFLNSNDTIKNNDCDRYIFKMVVNTKEYVQKRKVAELLGKCVNTGWFMYGSPNKISVPNRDTKHSESYDISVFCGYSEDELSFFETFSFDPKTNNLYLSENTGNASTGEYKMRFIKQVKYKKKWLRKFLKCQGKSVK